MPNLEDLVPPPELCEKIPPNEFDGSVFAWHLRIETGERFVAIRGSSNTDAGIVLFAPAPTLEETMLDLDFKGYFAPTCYRQADEWRVYAEEDSVNEPFFEIVEQCDMERAATAAMKLWLEVEGVK